MQRKRPDYRPVLAEADRFEPRVERALRRSLQRAKDRVSINALAMALAAKDARAALELLPLNELLDALAPVAAILRDSVTRGGRVAAAQVKA